MPLLQNLIGHLAHCLNLVEAILLELILETAVGLAKVGDALQSATHLGREQSLHLNLTFEKLH